MAIEKTNFKSGHCLPIKVTGQVCKLGLSLVRTGTGAAQHGAATRPVTLTLRQAVNEYRRPLQGLCISSSLAKKVCHIYRRHSQWKANCNVVICEEEGANIIQGFPGDEDYTDAIFGRVAHIVEGFSGVEYFTVGYEHQDCIIVKDTGVKSVKRYANVRFL